MNKLALKLLALVALIAISTACDDSDNDGSQILPDEPTSFADLEDEWVRLSLIYENKIEVMQTAQEEMIGSVDTGMPEGARYYSTNSGRYLTVINRDENETGFFDTGVSNHGDHGHQQKVRWLDLTLQSSVPTHFTSVNGNIVIFNDGDGSIIHVDENQLQAPAYSPQTMQLDGTVAHHGVGFRLNSGKFAVTFQSDTPPIGYEWGPQMVKFVTNEGVVIDDNGGVMVQGIHGSANNGSYGAFGSTEGVIIVDDQDNIDLIENAGDSLRSESGYWIGTLKSHGNSQFFYGRARNLGVYVIDPSQKTMNLLYEGNDMLGDMFSFNGEFYLLHTEGGKLRVYDANTANLITERVVEMADIPDSPFNGARSASSEVAQLRKLEEESPVLVCSDKYLYVLAPNRTDIKILSIADLRHVHTIRLENPVQSIAKNGFTAS